MHCVRYFSSPRNSYMKSDVGKNLTWVSWEHNWSKCGMTYPALAMQSIQPHSEARLPTAYLPPKRDTKTPRFCSISPTQHRHASAPAMVMDHGSQKEIYSLPDCYWPHQGPGRWGFQDIIRNWWELIQGWEITNQNRDYDCALLLRVRPGKSGSSTIRSEVLSSFRSWSTILWETGK